VVIDELRSSEARGGDMMIRCPDRGVVCDMYAGIAGERPALDTNTRTTTNLDAVLHLHGSQGTSGVDRTDEGVFTDHLHGGAHKNNTTQQAQ